MTCSLTTRDDSDTWCEYHQMHHRGHYRNYAIDPGEKGQEFRRYWDSLIGKPAPSKTLLRSLPIAKECIHLGKRLDRTRCGGEVWACKIHGTCSQQEKVCVGGMKFCQNCTDWQRVKPPPLTEFGNMQVWQEAYGHHEKPSPPEGFSTRHLLYHIYPVSGNGAWQWNVEQLCGRLKAFNGQKIVAIAADPPTGRLSDPTGPNSPDGGRVIPGCDSADKVRAEFAKRWPHDDITFLEFENDPKLREVKTLIPMLEMVLSDDPTHITLYAQAKGTTRKKGHIARRWTEALYEIMFDHFPLAEEQLKTYPVTGCFKKLGAGWDPTQSFSDYHFSGSWFWFRNADLYQRDWQKADQFWSGVEPYPSQHFRPSEAGCMFHEASVPAMNLYNQGYWKRTVIPQFNKWREENAKYRTEMWPR